MEEWGWMKFDFGVLLSTFFLPPTAARANTGCDQGGGQGKELRRAGIRREGTERAQMKRAGIGRAGIREKELRRARIEESRN